MLSGVLFSTGEKLRKTIWNKNYALNYAPLPIFVSNFGKPSNISETASSK